MKRDETNSRRIATSGREFFNGRLRRTENRGKPKLTVISHLMYQNTRLVN